MTKVNKGTKINLVDLYYLATILNGYIYLLYGFLGGFFLYYFYFDFDFKYNEFFSCENLLTLALQLLSTISVIYTLLHQPLRKKTEKGLQSFLKYMEGIRSKNGYYDEAACDFNYRRAIYRIQMYNLTLIYFLSSLIFFVIAFMVSIIPKSDEKVKGAFILGSISVQLMFFYLSIVMLFSLNRYSYGRIRKGYQNIKQQINSVKIIPSLTSGTVIGNQNVASTIAQTGTDNDSDNKTHSQELIDDNEKTVGREET